MDNVYLITWKASSQQEKFNTYLGLEFAMSLVQLNSMSDKSKIQAFKLTWY